MNVIYQILTFMFVIGLIVLVHEFGHFVAARLMKIRVDVFSFGFGKRLFGKKIGDTDFRVSLFPLGGYIRPVKRNSIPSIPKPMNSWPKTGPRKSSPCSWAPS
jgi:RIP metalloprotease RseP